MKDLIYTLWSVFRADPMALIIAGTMLLLVIIAAAVAEAAYEERKNEK